jgi:hypothetical protein
MFPWIILVGGWQARNYIAVGEPAFSGKQGEYLLCYFGAAIIAQRDGISIDEARFQRLGCGCYAEVHPETARWSSAQLNQRWNQEGWQLIRTYPWLFLKTYFLSIFNTMVGPGEDALLSFMSDAQEKTGPFRDFLTLPLGMFLHKWPLERPLIFSVFFLGALYLCCFYFVVLISTYHTMRTGSALSGAHLLLWCLILYFVALTGGYSRFRIPMMPLLALYAGQGLNLIAAWGRRRGQRLR